MNETVFSGHVITLNLYSVCCEQTVIILEKEKIRSVELVMQMLKGKWHDQEKNASNECYFVLISTGTYTRSRRPE